MATRRVEYHTLQVARESFFLDTRYTNLKPVGDGSYGFVCAADDALTGRRVAIKKVGDTFCDLVDAKRILREIKLLRVRACLRACDAWRRLEGWVWDLIDLVALILTPPPINTPPTLRQHFIGHENVIQIYDLLTVPPDTEDFRDVYIVTNLMESDMDRILGSNQPLTDQHFQYFLYQVCSPPNHSHCPSTSESMITD
jgi:serine/threonine protein kinase